MTKAYISGQITGDDYYINRFKKAEDKCKQVFDEVVNPCNLDVDLTKPWIWYIVRDIYKLYTGGFTHIIVLPNWHDSIGANIEVLVAEKLGLKRICIDYI